MNKNETENKKNTKSEKQQNRKTRKNSEKEKQNNRKQRKNRRNSDVSLN